MKSTFFSVLFSIRVMFPVEPVSFRSMLSMLCSIVSGLSQLVRFEFCFFSGRELSGCFCADPLEYNVSLYSLIGTSLDSSLVFGIVGLFSGSSYCSVGNPLSVGNPSLLFNRLNNFHFVTENPSSLFFLERLSFRDLIRFSLNRTT